MSPPRACMAARNNADLYAAVFTAKGLAFRRDAAGFVALDPPPPYYGHGVVTQPGAAEDLLRSVTEVHGPRVAIKDSFCEIDGPAHGLETLFDATWIWRAPGRTRPGRWRAVTTAIGLEQWEAAWKESSPTDGRMFPEGILAHPGMTVLVATEDGHVRAGCLANRSEDAIGMSNVFGRAAMADAAEAVGSCAPDLPVVGYERGQALFEALTAGFQAIGALRVLVPAQDNGPST
ncbi:hypothetical protein JANAI62_07430 [Jannaschia pagri]|uniref:Amidase n=1 Tax=Jannaschia pagri TaxID=2829797 RepID=A0ABQ4NI76_9RHOB|nr:MULTISPECIES: hypothetical protein [unclassified Jannaschia]GIT89772.1 hypothetical protein JANAI61_02300 [Jannaschia sp. AI_61]GIT94120.1 hypothetical protein JANAI62_07430 [Jannaschia sp. AI_62]